EDRSEGADGAGSIDRCGIPVGVHRDGGDRNHGEAGGPQAVGLLSYSAEERIPLELLEGCGARAGCSDASTDRDALLRLVRFRNYSVAWFRNCEIWSDLGVHVPPGGPWRGRHATRLPAAHHHGWSQLFAERVGVLGGGGHLFRAVRGGASEQSR